MLLSSIKQQKRCKDHRITFRQGIRACAGIFSKAQRALAILLSASMFLLFSANVAAKDHDCIKKVFSLFCLGGRFSASGDFIQQEPGNLYQYKNSRIYLTIRNKRVYKIARQIPPGEWFNYFNWTDKLSTKYGPGEDLSQYPPSASSRSSRLKAIIFKKGYARQRWQQGDWSIEVLWDSPDYIQIIYQLKKTKRPSFDLDNL